MNELRSERIGSVAVHLTVSAGVASTRPATASVASTRAAHVVAARATTAPGLWLAASYHSAVPTLRFSTGATATPWVGPGTGGLTPTGR